MQDQLSISLYLYLVSPVEVEMEEMEEMEKMEKIPTLEEQKKIPTLEELE